MSEWLILFFLSYLSLTIIFSSSKVYQQKSWKTNVIEGLGRVPMTIFLIYISYFLIQYLIYHEKEMIIGILSLTLIWLMLYLLQPVSYILNMFKAIYLLITQGETKYQL